MSLSEIGAEQAALDWVRRIADPHFADWDAHMRWLEEDPRNAEVFDRISLEMESVTQGLAPAGPLSSTVQVANDNMALARRRRWRIQTSVGGMVAAGVAALFMWPHHPGNRDFQTITTLPGVSRQIALVDGTRVALNGGSMLRTDGSRSVTLIDGEAYFDVVHHPDHPFRLQVGSRVIQDVGTSFDVAIAPRSTRISVAEGIVAIDPEAANIRLTAGQEARFGVGDDILRTTVTEDHAIGGWRQGRLVYQEASWTEVVTDLSRSLGVPVTLTPEMAERRFTGVIVLDSRRAMTMRRLAGAADVSAVQEGQGWRIAPR